MSTLGKSLLYGTMIQVNRMLQGSRML